MKLRQYLILVILPALFLVSCKSGYKKSETVNEKGQKQIHEWYADGILKSTQTFLNDDQSAFIYISWYESGALMDSARYVNENVQGLRKHYDESTGLLHLEEYSNGVMNGLHRAVYKNGATSFEGQRRNGVQTGEWKFHYPDGSPITYEYYDLDGKLIYFRKYDEEGKTIKSSGNPVLAIYHPSIPVNAGDTMKGTIEIALPENVSTNILIVDSINNPSKPLLIDDVQTKASNFLWTFTKSGKHKLWYILNIKDEKSGSVETSKTFREYSVGN